MKIIPLSQQADVVYSLIILEFWCLMCGWLLTVFQSLKYLCSSVEVLREMYQIKMNSRYVKQNFVPAIVYNPTVQATKPRLLKAFIDDIVLEMFLRIPWRLKTNRQTSNASLEVLINYKIVKFYSTKKPTILILCIDFCSIGLHVSSVYFSHHHRRYNFRKNM